MDELCYILKDLIQEKGISLRKLAEKSGVSATQYGTYLRGAMPTIDSAARICDYFACSLDYLCGLSEQRTSKARGYDMKNFLERYQKALSANKITHWKFCKQHGISESTLRHWQAGQTPRLETLIKIADGLSVSTDYLVGRK